MVVHVKQSTHLKRLSTDATSSVTDTADDRLSVPVASVDNLSLHDRCLRDNALLRTRSPEAQAYRRALLRGRRILIVQGGSEAKAFIYSRLRELGVHLTILDSPTSCWSDHPDVNQFIAFDPVGDGAEGGIVRRALTAISGLQFDAVTTYWEDAVFIAARVGEELGIATNPSSACAQARNKIRTRTALAKANLPVPRFARINSINDIAEAAQVVGFPAVLKPACGAASMGVVRVDNQAETYAAFAEISCTLDVANDTIWAQGTDMLLEELYQGDECDVDVLMCDGKVVYAKVSDNWACLPPWFQEMGTNCPSLLTKRKQSELVALAIDTLHAMAFRSGAFHVEVIYTSAGPRLIEVNARMGGVSVREVNLVAWGVDLIEEHAIVSCGIPIAPVVPENPLRYIAECAINAPYSGTINASNWLDSLSAARSMHKVHYFKNLNDKVMGPEDGIPDWIAEVLCTSEVSQEDACEKVREIVMELAPVPITPSVPGSEKPYFFPNTKHPFVVDRD